jgi:diguanylate cyclase (GGDEF)-like protein
MARPASDTQDDIHPACTAMAALLPVHSAVTMNWLVDATMSAAERMLCAPYTFVYFEEPDGRLERKSPASDIRRRTLQRALDGFGSAALPPRLDPERAPAIGEALDERTTLHGPATMLLQGLVPEDRAQSAQRQLGVDTVCIAPLEAAGERIGAMLLLCTSDPDTRLVRLFADHVSCAVVNLRQAQAARETGVVDVVRSVFDARKLEHDLQRELMRSSRYKRELSIAVIEATNLGLLRERFGTVLTDRLLQQLGEALAQDSREIDVIGAYKESGYTMVLTEASAGGAELASRRLLASARTASLGSEDVPGLELHLAAGWATFPGDGTTTDMLFEAAERRMYGDAGSRVA